MQVLCFLLSMATRKVRAINPGLCSSRVHVVCSHVFDRLYRVHMNCISIIIPETTLMCVSNE